MNWLKSLYAQQTTPDEVVIFLLLGTFLTLVVSFIAYAVIVVALSKWRMKKDYSVWSLLFPSPRRIRKYAAEYLLGILTALLLGLTVSAKHSAVEAVLAQDISVIGRDFVRSALPFHRLEKAELVDEGVDPVYADRVVAWLDEGVITPLSKSAGDFVRPLLAAGLADNANIIVREAVEAFGADSERIINQRFILWVAIGFLVAYVAWFGFQRSKEMQSETVRDPNYGEIIKRLSLPAVCIPLLLVSAVALENPDRLANSVMGYASVPDSTASTPLSIVLTNQAEAVKRGELAIDARDLEQVNKKLEAISLRLDGWSRDITGLQNRIGEAEDRLVSVLQSLASEEARTESLIGSLVVLKEELVRIAAQAERGAADAQRAALQVGAQVDALSTRFSSIEARVGRLQQMLTSLGTQIKELSGDTGTLLVQTNVSGGRYTVVRRSDNRVVARGEFIGVHVLPPGQYRVSAGNQREDRRITADSGTTVQIMFSTIQ